MVLANDYLATMAWAVATSGFLLGVASITFSSAESLGILDEKNSKLQKSFAFALGLIGVYLFLSGLHISFVWPFTITGGVYNVLFGGIATVGGLVLILGGAAVFFNLNLKPVTYVAAIAGLYAAIDAFAMLKYGLTDSPPISALGYLSFTAPAILSVVVAHSKNKLWRYLFAIFAFLFAVAWLLQAVSYTMMHLQPP